MQKKTSLLYKMIKWCVRLIYAKVTVVGAENLPDEPCVVVANHTQLHGPLSCELYFPGYRYTWCAGQMMRLKDVPAYAYSDFWSGKPWFSRWFYKIVSYLIAPLSVCIFNNANTIAVYRDSRIISTFRNTVKALQEGANVVIFPECGTPCNHIVYEFQNRFIDIAKLYYKRNGKALPFVPMYIAPKLKQMHIGKPVYFDPAAPIEEERRRLCEQLKSDITAIAEALPLHTVVPYRNIPKKYYPKNRQEVTDHEKNGG